LDGNGGGNECDTPMVVANLPRKFADFGHIPPNTANFGPRFATVYGVSSVRRPSHTSEAASPAADGLTHVILGWLRRPGSPQGFLSGRLACNDL